MPSRQVLRFVMPSRQVVRTTDLPESQRQDGRAQGGGIVGRHGGVDAARPGKDDASVQL